MALAADSLIHGHCSSAKRERDSSGLFHLWTAHSQQYNSLIEDNFMMTTQTLKIMLFIYDFERFEMLTPDSCYIDHVRCAAYLLHWLVVAFLDRFWATVRLLVFESVQTLISDEVELARATPIITNQLHTRTRVLAFVNVDIVFSPV